MPDQIPGAPAPVPAAAAVVTPSEGGAQAIPNEKPADPSNQKPAEAPVEGADGGEDDDGTGDFADDNAEPAENKRKTAKDYIIKRQQAKIAKLKAKQDAAGDQNAPPEGEPGDDPDAPEGDDTDDPDGSPLEGLTPIVEEHIAAQDAKEVNDFLKTNPDFEPYKSKVERWMKHPSRRHLPVRTIFAEVAMDHVMKIGAERERKAAAQARDTRAGGGSNRESTSPIDWKTATKEQLYAEQERVRKGA